MTATPPATPHVPGYTIRRHLARGGMAEVYVAEQIALQRPVALKVLRMAEAGGADAVERFEQETRLIAELSHPNIVGIHDVGHASDGALYYAMPFLPGGDLTAKAPPLPPAEIRRLLAALLDALRYAHGKGIVHRDIKPANVLFDEHGTPQLADFGVALRTVNSERLTQVGLTVGSTGYMSPEQARGMPVDARSDLYSMGVLAYELLTGHLPFRGADAVEIAIAQMEQKVPRLPKDRAQWQGFIDKALARQPAQRFQTAADMATALDRVPHAAPLLARRGLAVAAGALVLGLAAWALWPSAKPMSAAEIERLIATDRLLPPARPNALDGLIAAPKQADFDRLRIRLDDALRTRTLAAIDARRWGEVERHYTGWHDASVRLGRAPDTRTSVTKHLDAALRAQFDTAIAAYDRSVAEPALPLIPLVDQPSIGLTERRDLLLQIPRRADGIVDGDGPRLGVIKAPTYTDKGTAVSIAPVGAALYARYAEAKGLEPVDCEGDAATATVARCVTYAEARDFARWFSQQSGQSYRLPSVAEWEAAGDSQAWANAGPAIRVWSRDCRTVRTVHRPNAVRRGLGKVREVFGGRGAAVQVSQNCAGQLSLSPPGTDGASTAHASGLRSTEIGIGLVRDIAALPRPAD